MPPYGSFGKRRRDTWAMFPEPKTWTKVYNRRPKGPTDHGTLVVRTAPSLLPYSLMSNMICPS